MSDLQPTIPLEDEATTDPDQPEVTDEVAAVSDDVAAESARPEDSRDAGDSAEPEGVEPEAAEPLPEARRFDFTDPSQAAEAVDAARLAIEAGECVVLPTDTVYGIGADAFSGEAVQRLLDAKNRGRDMPPPVLISDAAMVKALAVDVPDQATQLIEKHWPGPLTVILKVQKSLKIDLGDAQDTIALRVPDHDGTRDILRQTGPMAVSSANLSGRPAAVDCDEARAQLGNRVSVYLDGGRLGGADSAPSTMVDFTQSDAGHVLRHGAIPVAILRETLPDLEDLTDDPEVEEPAETADLTEPTESVEQVESVEEIEAAADPVDSGEVIEPAQLTDPAVETEPKS